MENSEIRSVKMDNVSVDAEKRTITGKAIVYNKQSEELRTKNGGRFRETILPGALGDSLRNNDIRALVEHNPEKLLGRTSSGTVRLKDGPDGLDCEIDMPETSYGNDALALAKRGDIRGFSFRFNNPKERVFSKGGKNFREISSMDVDEVSLVGSPAYPDTSVSLRSEDFVEEKIEVAPVDEAKVEEKTETISVDMSSMNMRHRHNENKWRGSTSFKQTPNK